MNRGRRHFPGAVSTPHHAPLGEPSVALVAQKTRCGQGGRGRAAPSPSLPYRRPGRRAARRNPDTPVPARQPYRPPRRYPSHSRTPYAPRGATRSVPSPGLPCQSSRSRGRRVGTLPRPCRIDARTVHDRRARAIPVPPTRRGRGSRAATQATPSSRRRRPGASQPPGAPVRPSRDHRHRTRRPRRRAGHA